MKPLAGAIPALLMVIEGMEAPDKVCRVNQALWRALCSPTPQKSMNASSRNLRRAGGFYSLHLWLEQPEVLRQAKRSGAYWAWRIWKKASIDIHNGQRASVAFGMNASGRPKQAGFSITEDAAIYTMHLHINKQLSKSKARERASDLFGASVRDIEKACKSVPLCDANLERMAELSLMKYRIKV